MAKKYDPKADYVVVGGTASLKDENNNRILVKSDDVDAKGKKPRVKLAHLESHEIAFLVERKGLYMLASDWEKSQKGVAANG